VQKRDDRPMGVAVRRYFTSPRHDDDMLESWLELKGDDGSNRIALPQCLGDVDGQHEPHRGVRNARDHPEQGQSAYAGHGEHATVGIERHGTDDRRWRRQLSRAQGPQLSHSVP